MTISTLNLESWISTLFKVTMLKNMIDNTDITVGKIPIKCRWNTQVKSVSPLGLYPTSHHVNLSSFHSLLKCFREIHVSMKRMNGFLTESEVFFLLFKVHVISSIDRQEDISQSHWPKSGLFPFFHDKAIWHRAWSKHMVISALYLLWKIGLLRYMPSKTQFRILRRMEVQHIIYYHLPERLLTVPPTGKQCSLFLVYASNACSGVVKFV